MLQLQVKGAWCYVLNALPHEWDELSRFLSFTVEAYGQRTWPRKMLQVGNRRFPTGYLSRVAKKFQFQVTGIETGDEQCDNDFLRDYQSEGVNTALKIRRGIVSWPPGAGKTLAIGAMLESHSFNRVLFVTVSSALVQQTCQKLAKFGLTATTKPGTDSPICVVTHQLLTRRFKKLRKWLSEVDTLIVDEAHHVPAKTIYKMAMECDAIFRVGLTATPIRDDGLEFLVEAAFGPIIHTVHISELIAKGYLANPTLLMISVPRMPSDSYDYAGVYDDVIINNEVRNELVLRAIKLLQTHRPTQVLVDRIPHAYLLGELCSEATVVTGNDPDKYKHEVLEDFEKGDIPILISTPLLKEGADFPLMRSLVMAGSSKSLVNTVQSVGRVLRPAPNKNPIVIDFLDHTRYVLKHALARRRILEAEIGPVRVLPSEYLPEL